MGGSQIFTTWAAVGGLVFVAVAVVVNVIYVRARLPLPVAGKPLAAVITDFDSAGDRLPWPSVVVPTGWLGITVFAAGMTSIAWDAAVDSRMWALVGFAGVMLQNASFAIVEALRFGLAAAARLEPSAVAGLWAFSNVLFGFNQLFLATALIGFTAASASIAPEWLAIVGYLSAAALFIAASASPFNARGASRTALLGLIGWLGWMIWIAGHCVVMVTR
ncbi:hypothetical protein [Mycolicibacterium neworleansense]|uniref:Integral membrane protein n=1 Tax=Mycolicibacterium neworleansense TaxID=146018 RepID=A0A0H5RJT9_9MYCO|nr:hypothetical protein [Mycolicibacterium neworleansense]MCV7361723.1 hypothetical protein [Mycolicibacterium neworleansense]CRZ14026.1 hypothetical protein BN2156_00874 [Mycolicibacterium neworleansense]